MVEEHVAARRHGIHAKLGADDIARYRSARRMLPPPPASVLDVGCGVGALTDWLLDEGYETTGVDANEDLMAGMRSPHRVGRAERLPFNDGAFEAVVCSEVLEHLRVDAYPSAVDELGRVARSVIVVTVPNAESLESATTRCPACGCIYSIHHHVRRFDRGRLEGLLQGWRMTAIEEVGPWKARHRTIEWYIRRRLLGSWPRKPGADCPQCGAIQPGAVVGVPPRAGGARPLRVLAGFPWRQRWWLTARYERGAAQAETQTPGPVSWDSEPT